MRTVFDSQLSLDTTQMQDIEIDANSRDDIVMCLYGLQQLFLDDEIRKKLFDVLEREYKPEVRKDRGRPGMDLWRVLVLAILKQSTDSDYDRLAFLANEVSVLREILMHGKGDKTRYNRQTILDNVSALTPTLLAEVNQLIVEAGHKMVEHQAGTNLKGRCDSKVVKTNARYPTDMHLLWDATRCLIRECFKASEAFGMDGWRQHKSRTQKVYAAFQAIRNARRYRFNRKGVKAYLRICRVNAAKGRKLWKQLDEQEQRLKMQHESGECSREDEITLEAIIATKSSILEKLNYINRFADQIRRRVLEGEKIPHGEKVFSIFKPYTRWISKGKAGVQCELGVPAAIVEDQYQFLLSYVILWDGTDKDVAVSLIRATQKLYPDLKTCSFDRGFYSPAVSRELNDLLEVNAMLKKGACSKAEKAYQNTPEFKQARKGHSAVESALNNLDHRGWSKVREVSKEDFERVVATAVVAANVHRLGRLVRQKVREQFGLAA